MSAPGAPHRRRRRLLFAAIVVAVLAYPVLGTLALWTGLAEKFLHSEDLRVEIDNPSYTIWPGRIHLKRVRVLVNGETQFILEGHDLLLDIEILELVKRRVHLTELVADRVRYQMRVQVEDSTGIEERVAAYPPLTDLPGAKVVREKVAQQTEPREAEWTVHVEGIDVSVLELWFFEYRYLGDGRLRGAFLVGPQVMSVTTAVQDLGPGELRFGEKQPIAKQLRGQVTADIPEINPEEHADVSFFELVTARVNLRADVLSLAHVGAYLDGMDVSRGDGGFAADLYLEKGRLGTKSHLEYATEAIQLKGNGFAIGSDWDVNFNASGEDGKLPLLKTSSKATYASLARKDKEFTVQIHGHREEVALDTIQLSGSTKFRRASVRMPTIVSVDLDDLGEVLAPETPLEVESGDLRASLSLDMDQDYWVRGPLSAAIHGANFTVAGVNITGNTALKAQVRANPELKVNALESVSLAMREVGMHVGDEHVEGWWMNLTSPRLAMWSTEPPRAEAAISVRAKDLEPVLESLAEKDVLNDLIAKFTSLDDFRCKLMLRKSGETMDVVVESESDVWDASGRVYVKGEQQRMAIVVGGQAVSLGIADMGTGLEIQPFAKTDWLNARLRRFPEKPVQLPASKP